MMPSALRLFYRSPSSRSRDWCRPGALLIASVALVVTSAPQTGVCWAWQDGIPISLWQGKAPLGDGTFEAADARLTVYPIAEEATATTAANRRTAIVICPGGGYGGLVTGAEGHGIAKWLNQQGIVGAVLEYRLPKGRSEVPLADAQRALRTLRHQADRWNIHRVGIIGFSAGGHLASTAGTHFDQGTPEARDPVARASCRPDFLILVYPVISMGDTAHRGSRQNLLGKQPSEDSIARFSNERQVTRQTPPAFLAHAVDDRVVPISHSRQFAQALAQADVPVKLLELPQGGHGLNRYQGPMWDAWQRQSLVWLEQQNLLPAKPDNSGN